VTHVGRILSIRHVSSAILSGEEHPLCVLGPIELDGTAAITIYVYAEGGRPAAVRSPYPNTHLREARHAREHMDSDFVDDNQPQYAVIIIQIAYRLRMRSA
jgi:hypothetical protein